MFIGRDADVIYTVHTKYKIWCLFILNRSIFISLLYLVQIVFCLFYEMGVQALSKLKCFAILTTLLLSALILIYFVDEKQSPMRAAFSWSGVVGLSL